MCIYRCISLYMYTHIYMYTHGSYTATVYTAFALGASATRQGLAQVDNSRVYLRDAQDHARTVCVVYNKSVVHEMNALAFEEPTMQSSSSSSSRPAETASAMPKGKAKPKAKASCVTAIYICIYVPKPS